TPRALPSFPTRRSSDLYQHLVLRIEFLEIIPFVIITKGSRKAFRRRMQRVNHMERSFLRMWVPLEIATYQSAKPPPIIFGVRSRSEEHTSELQSRENLV